MQILIVDDDPVTLQILSASLHRSGYDVIQLCDGISAWEHIKIQPARFLITDWLMPGLDGPELIDRIRGFDFPSYTYIIILTAKGDKSDIIDGLSAGADDYLVKPFNLHELNARIMIGTRILDLEDHLIKAREDVEAMALHDPLTQLLNRRAVYQHTQAEVNRTLRTQQPISLLTIDIDGLKLLNDQFGPLSGDQVILHAARQISSTVRSYDWVGRWGGDEFLVVLPGSGIESAHQVAMRIQEAISIPLSLGETPNIIVTASIGITTSQESSELNIDALLKQSEQALRQAKEAGLNQIEVY